MGRHRGLPDNIDAAIVIPDQKRFRRTIPQGPTGEKYSAFRLPALPLSSPTRSGSGVPIPQGPTGEETAHYGPSALLPYHLTVAVKLADRQSEVGHSWSLVRIGQPYTREISPCISCLLKRRPGVGVPSRGWLGLGKRSKVKPVCVARGWPSLRIPEAPTPHDLLTPLSM